MLGTVADESVEALTRRTDPVHELARELLGVVAPPEVQPEKRQAAGRVVVAAHVELVERLEGELTGFPAGPHQNFCTTRRRWTISSAVTAAS